MTTFTNDWEFWLDENISPIISKWLMDEVKIKCSSFHFLKLNNTHDIEIYNLARNRDKVIIISKDEDYRAIVAWKGAPQKLIAIQFGNCSNKTLWKKLKAEIYNAIDKLIYGDLDIFDIK